jgi:hypothetical protein
VTGGAFLFDDEDCRSGEMGVGEPDDARAASGRERTGGAVTGFPGVAARNVGLVGGCGRTAAFASR